MGILDMAEKVGLIKTAPQPVVVKPVDPNKKNDWKIELGEVHTAIKPEQGTVTIAEKKPIDTEDVDTTGKRPSLKETLMQKKVSANEAQAMPPVLEPISSDPISTKEFMAELTGENPKKDPAENIAKIIPEVKAVKATQIPEMIQENVDQKMGAEIFENSKNSPEKINNQEIIVDETKEVSERQFVFIFLKEISDIVEKGKELEVANEERSKAATEKKSVEENSSVLRDSAKQIEESIKAFMEANETPDLVEKLKITLSTFGEYLTAFEQKISEDTKKSRTTDNSLLTKINAKQTEIKKLITTIGGQTNFDKIKKGIKDAERISSIAKQQAEKGNVSRTTIDMINTETVKVVSEDLHGMQMLLTGGAQMGVVDILIRIFNKQTK